jgi:hypothetical protein
MLFCRSFCILSIIITSALQTASSALWATEAPSASIPIGIMVGGPARTTLAPIFVNPTIFDLATLLWDMSPIIAIRSPLIDPLFSMTVIRSRSDWVGWACIPSPALIIENFIRRASICGAPAEECRNTITSGFMASRFRAVSIRVSPFTMLLVFPDIERLSALSLLAAISKDVRVRVLGS